MTVIGDWKNMDGYVLVHGQEGAGSRGVGGVKIFVRFDEATKKALDALSDDRSGGLSSKEKENSIWRHVGDEVDRIRREQALRLDPDTHARAAKTKADFAKAFADAGLGPIFMEPVPNEYWPKTDPYGTFDPWFKVATPIGYIKIGWRKRVINIDWSETILLSLVKNEYDYSDRPRRPRGTELFQFALDANETTTVGDFYVHAYGYEKATAYLQVLAVHAQKQSTKQP